MSLDDDNNEINNSKKIFLTNILKNLRMKKILFCSALAAVALASCSSDDFMGDTSGSTPTSANSAIKFDGNAGKISRATSNSGTVAQMLDGQFKIYGVKKIADNKYSDVFKDYSIWYNTNHTTSNTNDWEYVGQNGNSFTPNTGTTITLGKDQTIKYWDYASTDYHFVAGSPINAFTYKLKEGTGDIESATISGLGGHITAKPKVEGSADATEPSPVYVAEPVVVSSDDYKKPVKFTFVRQQTKVRVGIYETIPGYSISKINFYAYDNATSGLKVSDGNNIILTSGTDKYFSGGTNISGTITYNWTNKTYAFTYTGNSLTESKNWYGGKFAKGVEATVSTETDKAKLYGTDADMESTGYFTVLPTPSATPAKPILIKCDYTLTSVDGSKETIEVKGATAAIPEAYSKWNTNTLYTYIFKISDNTNGYTGSDDPGHVGLYPITFDAVVAAEKFGTQGTITTFTTPSITTYQDGSVVANGGIKYVANKKIDVTVTESTSGTIKDLHIDNIANEGHIAVYKFDAQITEAEVQLKGVADKTAETGSVSNNVFTFTPNASGWYVIQYLAKAENTENNTPAVYTYKVVKVETE